MNNLPRHAPSRPDDEWTRAFLDYEPMSEGAARLELEERIDAGRCLDPEYVASVLRWPLADTLALMREYRGAA